MMKKTIKKLLAALLAVAMVCAMAIPAFAENSEGDVDSHHTYSAFQIFKGDVEGNNIKDLLKTLRFPTLIGAATSSIILMIF